MRYIKTFESFEDQIEIGDWVYLTNMEGVGDQVYNMVLFQPAKLTKIKKMTNTKTKYTLTYSKGWQKTFIVDTTTNLSLPNYITKIGINDNDIEKYEKEYAEYLFKQDVKRYNL
jgi:hypothetical protein